jgi:lysophospholipase L1-like esterase
MGTGMISPRRGRLPQTVRRSIVGLGTVIFFVLIPSGVNAYPGASGGAEPRAVPAAAARSARVYRILPLGDSITRGVGELNAKGQAVGWRERLQQDLRSGAAPAGFRYNFVGSQHDDGARDGDHEGHGGWTIDQLSANIAAWMAQSRPDVVLLHAGTNNVTRGEQPDVIAGKLAGLIAQIREDSPRTRILVAKIIGTQGLLPGEKKNSAAYAARIPGVVEAAGGARNGVYLVDQSSVWGVDIFDYHHPNARGYDKMAFNWYMAMLSVLGGTWRPVVNPYLVKRAEICTFDMVRRKRVCAVRTVRRS